MQRHASINNFHFMHIVVFLVNFDCKQVLSALYAEHATARFHF